MKEGWNTSMLMQFLCDCQEWIKDPLTAIVWCHVHTYCTPRNNVRVLKCGLQGREQPDADWSAAASLHAVCVVKAWSRTCWCFTVLQRLQSSSSISPASHTSHHLCYFTLETEKARYCTVLYLSHRGTHVQEEIYLDGYQTQRERENTQWTECKEVATVTVDVYVLYLYTQGFVSLQVT